MDPETIREARRLLKALVFTGEARLSTGSMLSQEDYHLFALLERIASKKVEEVVEVPKVEGFTPQQTYREEKVHDDSPEGQDKRA